jgi:hypothetical protein
MIIINLALLVICGFLCYENDVLIDQAKHDEQWKAAADRRIKELENELLSKVEI